MGDEKGEKRIRRERHKRNIWKCREEDGWKWDKFHEGYLKKS